MRRFTLGVLAMAASIGAIDSCVAQEKVVLTHALPQLSPSFAIASSLPTYLGYWKEEGLEVEVVTTPGAAAAAQLMAGGRADISYGNPSSAMTSVQKGANVKFYYTSIRGDIFGIGLPAESGISDLAGIKGKTVGVSSFASGSTLYAKALLATAGFTESDYNLVEIGVGARAAALVKANQVQVVSLWDEAFAALEKGGVKIAKVITDPRAKNFIAGSLATPADNIEKRRKMLVGVARGMAKAQLFEANNPEAAIRIHWKVYPQSAPRAGVTLEAVAEELKVTSTRYPKHARDMMGTGKFGDIPKANMEDFQNYLVQTGQLTEKLPVERYYTNELITEINDFDAKKIVEQAKTIKLD